jgi:hypothetical protein
MADMRLRCRRPYWRHYTISWSYQAGGGVQLTALLDTLTPNDFGSWR